MQASKGDLVLGAVCDVNEVLIHFLHLDFELHGPTRDELLEQIWCCDFSHIDRAFPVHA